MGRADYETSAFLGFGTHGGSWNRYLEDIKGRLNTPRILLVLVGDITTLSHWRPLGKVNGVRRGLTHFASFCVYPLVIFTVLTTCVCVYIYVYMCVCVHICI